MPEFINTIEVLGDDAVIDSIIERTITEFKDNVLIDVGQYAFYGCTALKTVDLPNVEQIGQSAFQDCTSMTEMRAPNASLYNANRIFQGCTNLKLFEHGGSKRPGSSDGPGQYGQYLFSSCVSLESISIEGNVGQAMFEKCTSLKIVDVTMGGINGYVAFSGCTALKALVLRQENAIHTMGNTGALNMCTPFQSGTAYIYVPRSLVDTYKSATNWSTYAAQFRALEDYTVDGTVTGKLDETKI